jgi:hypothetical protein
MNKHLLVLTLACLTLVSLGRAQNAAPAVVSKPATLKLGAGFDYSRGDYGFSQPTEVSSVPVNLTYEQDRWIFKASLPYITIKGPASVVTGPGSAAGAPPRPTTNSESGVGDAMVSATFHARPVPGELNVDFTGRVKFGTASESKGLGTGMTDYYVQADLYQNFGAITPFGNVGYRMLGSNPTYPLKDGFYATAGAAYRLNDKTVVGAAYDWRSRIVSGAQNGTDAIGFFSVNPDDKWNFLGYVIVGFNDASPDYGVGGLATFKF